MDNSNSAMAKQVALAACDFEQQRTGNLPKSVTVVLSGDTVVITLHGALSPAEKALAKSPAGAAEVQDFHRHLFNNSADSLRQEIKRITGREVREATAEIETATGAVVHAFTTGAMVQMFLLAPEVLPLSGTDRDSIERADDDGFPPVPEHDTSRGFKNHNSRDQEL